VIDTRFRIQKRWMPRTNDTLTKSQFLAHRSYQAVQPPSTTRLCPVT
jgi:hypothetical protein